MIRPRSISALIKRCFVADPKLDSVVYDQCSQWLTVKFYSADAWIKLHEEIDIPHQKYAVNIITGGRKLFVLAWRCQDILNVPKFNNSSSGFAFNRGAEKRARRLVTEQEDEGAEMINGTRHIGSGAIPGLKSDASSDVWQQEAKQTERKSFGLKIDMLDKITREARVQGKNPMVFLRFTNVPDESVMEDDWVIMPKSAFEKIVK